MSGQDTSPTGSATAALSAERTFWRAFAAAGVLRFVLSVVVPFTTDEAYFVIWGRHLDYGYYDHGAMTGWWLWAVSFLGDAAWVMRLPAVLVAQFVGWALWRMLTYVDREKAAWAATIFIVSPVSLLCFLITTDTPLLFFSVVAVMFTLRGVRHGGLGNFFAAGLALGFAFLSKYFAVLLGLSFAVLLLGCLGRPRVRELVVLLAGIIPGVGINVAWNYHHAWVNVLFNLFNRQADNGLELLSPLMYVGLLLLIAGPGVIMALLRRPASLGQPWREAWKRMQADGTAVFFIVLLVPLWAFFLVAFTHRIGAHWVLSYFPFLAGVLFARFDATTLRRMARPTAIYTAVPVAISLILPFLPVEWARWHRSAFSLVMAVHPESVFEEIAPYRSRYLLTTPSYAKSALLGFHLGENVPVFGRGSYHGRQDDLLTDIRTWDGRDIMVVSDRMRDMERCQGWFARSEIREHTVRGAKMYVLLGEEFSYARYRDEVLKMIGERYYAMPGWLERFAAGNFFRERYGL